HGEIDIGIPGRIILACQKMQLPDCSKTPLQRCRLEARSLVLNVAGDRIAGRWEEGDPLRPAPGGKHSEIAPVRPERVIGKGAIKPIDIFHPMCSHLGCSCASLKPLRDFRFDERGEALATISRASSRSRISRTASPLRKRRACNSLARAM